MNPGELNKRITIQRCTDYEDDNNINKQKWEDMITIWSSMNNLQGKEFWEAKKYKAENTVEFVIRYSSCPDISIKDRIKHKNLLYNIFSIDNVLYKNEVLKIKATEVISNGFE